MDFFNDNIVEYGGVRIYRLISPAIKLSLSELYPLSLNPTAFPDKTIELPVNAWLVEYGDKRVLIDTGINNVGEDKLPVTGHPGDSFIEQLALYGIKPEAITHVIHTHLHLDHVGWSTLFNNGSWVPTFINASYFASKLEVAYQLSEKGMAEGGGAIFRDSVLPLILTNQLKVLADEQGEISTGISYQLFPGHSPGHMVIWLETSNAVLCFCGDIFHTIRQIENPQLASSFCRNTQQALSSRKTFLKRAAHRGAIVFSAHLDLPSVGTLHATDTGYKWLPYAPSSRFGK